MIVPCMAIFSEPMAYAEGLRLVSTILQRCQGENSIWVQLSVPVVPVMPATHV